LVRLTRLLGAATVLVLSAVALAAQPPLDTPATPTPTPTPSLEPDLDPFLDPKPTATPELPTLHPDDQFLLEDLVEESWDPGEEMGPPAPDDPVARIEGQLTVKDKKKKKKEKERKEELAGKVPDKAWLSEVCPIEDVPGATWLDRSQERLGWSVCRATLWFDGLFGDPRAIAERDTTYGYVQPKLDYNEEDGVDPDGRFRAKFNLPLADRRFNALLGRNESDDGEESRETDRDDGSEQLPESFRDADDDWLVGLGYSPVRGARKRLDFDAGIEVSTPPDFFAQGRYRRHWFLSQRDLVRARQTVFWRTDDGFGTRLNFDFERVLNRPYVARWRNAVTWAQEIEGVEWFSEVTLFQRLGERTALAYQLSADGATDAEVPVKNYGFEVIYRRNILREWLFLELRPGLDWRRRELEDNRELEPVMSIGLQINFGDREFE
jgi:hypothetical protein